MKKPGKSKDQNKQKEDHLSPTPIEGNKPVKAPEKSKNLSHKEVQDKLEVYERIGHMMDEYSAVQEIKERYQKEVRDIEANRTIEDIHYAQGIRAGLPHAHHESIKDGRERSDQQIRDEIAKEAKEIYNKNQPMRDYFKEHQPPKEEVREIFEKIKDKGMDREK